MKLFIKKKYIYFLLKSLNLFIKNITRNFLLSNSLLLLSIKYFLPIYSYKITNLDIFKLMLRKFSFFFTYIFFLLETSQKNAFLNIYYNERSCSQNLQILLRLDLFPLKFWRHKQVLTGLDQSLHVHHEIRLKIFCILDLVLVF